MNISFALVWFRMIQSVTISHIPQQLCSRLIWEIVSQFSPYIFCKENTYFRTLSAHTGLLCAKGFPGLAFGGSNSFYFQLPFASYKQTKLGSLKPVSHICVLCHVFIDLSVPHPSHIRAPMIGITVPKDVIAWCQTSSKRRADDKIYMGFTQSILNKWYWIPFP